MSLGEWLVRLAMNDAEEEWAGTWKMKNWQAGHTVGCHTLTHTHIYIRVRTKMLKLEDMLTTKADERSAWDEPASIMLHVSIERVARPLWSSVSFIFISTSSPFIFLIIAKKWEFLTPHISNRCFIKQTSVWECVLLLHKLVSNEKRNKKQVWTQTIKVLQITLNRLCRPGVFCSDVKSIVFAIKMK